ncbi:MAG: ComEC/Rec2 family competence protein [Bacteroidia bacterium]
MYAWRHIPLLRFLLPYILGIVCSGFFEKGAKITLITGVALLVFILASHFYLIKRINRQLQMLNSVLVVVVFFILGVLFTLGYSTSSYSESFREGDYDNVLVRVTSQPKVSEKSIGCEASILRVKKDSNITRTQGLAQLYFQKDSISSSIRYGDYLWVNCNLAQIESPKNPYQFNFKSYYANKNIYHQGFVKSSHWEFTGENEGNFLYRLSYAWQEKLKVLFDRHFRDQSIKGVAEALVFGYKEDLDDDWMDAFSKTGTIHVLAVSGLHVGIIFILLSFVLGLKRSKGTSLLIKSIIAVSVLFLYCLLTGFAPSVSRASLMFSTVILAKAFNRNSNIYNTLCFAAIVLLLINPFSIYNVGFQFSFLAVIGIVYYKDKFRSLWPQSTWLSDKIVTLLSVSVAAQITTFPLGLYYFHQYPNLFMISNLIVIPCITIVLYAGVLFSILGLFNDFIAEWLSSFMEVYISFIAQVVHFIQDIPYAFFENVHITFTQMLLLYGFIIAYTVTLVHKWKTGFVFMLLVFGGFIYSDWSYESDKNHSEVICFDQRNETILGFRSGSKVSIIASEGVYANEDIDEFLIEPYLINNRLEKHSIFPQSCLQEGVRLGEVYSNGEGFLYFENNSFLLLDNLKSFVKDTLHVDVLIIGKMKSDRYLTKVLPLIKFKKCVVLNSWRSDEAMEILQSRRNVIRANRFVILP